MSLNAHKAKVLIGVGMGNDGRLCVSDDAGTLRIEGGTLSRSRSSIYAAMCQDDDVQSVSSFHSKKITKNGSTLGLELSTLKIPVHGSMRSSISNTSMQRKINHLKHDKQDKRLSSLPDILQDGGGMNLWDDYKSPNRFDTMRTWSSLGKYKKNKDESKQVHTYASSYAGSMDRIGENRKELDMETIKRYKQQMNNRRTSKGSDRESQISKKRHSRDAMQYRSKNLKLSEEKLPGVTFIILSILLLSSGLIKLLVSWWHSYFCALWTGFIILILGLLGVSHKGNYFSKSKSIPYILFGNISAICGVITVSLSTSVFYPLIVHMALKSTPEEIILGHKLNFTSMDRALAIQIEAGPMVWATVAVDGIIIVITSLSLFSMSYTIVALNCHWEAVYKFTGECDHRGVPNSFNPVSQVLIGLIHFYFAAVTNALWATDVQHYFLIFIAPALIIFVGYVNLSYGKRPDVRGLGLFSLVVNGLVIVVIAIAIIFTVFDVVADIMIIDEYRNGPLPGIAPMERTKYIFSVISVTADLVYILLSLMNIVFTIGIQFRNGKTFLAPNAQHLEKS